MFFLNDTAAEIRYLLLCTSQKYPYQFGIPTNATFYEKIYYPIKLFVLYYYFFLRIANVLIHWTLGSHKCSIL